MNLWFVLGAVALGSGIVGSWVPWMVREWADARERREDFRRMEAVIEQLETEQPAWRVDAQRESLKAAAMAPLYRGDVRGNSK